MSLSNQIDNEGNIILDKIKTDKIKTELLSFNKLIDKNENIGYSYQQIISRIDYILQNKKNISTNSREIIDLKEKINSLEEKMDRVFTYLSILSQTYSINDSEGNEIFF